jgi:hypothetical protein
VIRGIVPVVTGTSTLGAHLAMVFSMTDDPPASDNDIYVHSCLLNNGEAREVMFDKVVKFAASDFKGAHSAIRLVIS